MLIEFALTRNMMAAVLMNSTSSIFEKRLDRIASTEGCRSILSTKYVSIETNTISPTSTTLVLRYAKVVPLTRKLYSSRASEQMHSAVLLVAFIPTVMLASSRP